MSGAANIADADMPIYGGLGMTFMGVPPAHKYAA